MRIYHLEINVIRYCEERYFSGVYGTYEKALEVGKKRLEGAIKNIFFDFKNIIDIENTSVQELLEKIDVYDYTFEITEIEDLEYAENFDTYLYPEEKYLEQNIKPTHIVNYLNYNGEVTEKVIEYRENNTTRRYARFIMEPEDFEKDAGRKFKIGDIVKVKRNRYRLELDTNDKLYVVRYLPKKVEGQPYFNNTYALISEYSDGLFTFSWREKDIEKYEGNIESDSPIGLIQRIVKGDLKVSDELWRDLKNGHISFDTRPNYKTIEELKIK